MPIIVRLDAMLARRRLTSKALAAQIGITEANLSLLKQGKVKGVRFDTLDKLCAQLNCQPGDLLAHEPEEAGADLQANADADGEHGGKDSGRTAKRPAKTAR